MSRVIGGTIGLDCNGHGFTGKLVRIEYERNDDGTVTLSSISGRNLGTIDRASRVTLSADEFSNRPHDPYDGAVWLYLSPIYSELSGHAPGNLGVWMSTNGGPILLATLDHDANLLWDEGDQDWFEGALWYFGLDDTDDLVNAVNAALNN